MKRGLLRRWWTAFAAVGLAALFVVSALPIPSLPSPDPVIRAAVNPTQVTFSENQCGTSATSCASASLGTITGDTVVILAQASLAVSSAAANDGGSDTFTKGLTCYSGNGYAFYAVGITDPSSATKVNVTWTTGTSMLIVAYVYSGVVGIDGFSACGDSPPGAAPFSSTFSVSQLSDGAVGMWECAYSTGTGVTFATSGGSTIDKTVAVPASGVGSYGVGHKTGLGSGSQSLSATFTSSSCASSANTRYFAAFMKGPPVSAGAITPASPSIDNGQSITLTANPADGTGPYTYVWYSGPSGACDSAGWSSTSGSSTYTPSPSATTLYCYQVTDANSVSATSTTDTVTVNGALTASTNPTSATIDSGQSITISAVRGGGTAPFSYVWYLGPSGACDSSGWSSFSTASSITRSPTSTILYCVAITDSAYTPETVDSATVTVTVNSALTVGAVTPTTPTIDNGQTVTLTAHPSGGTTPYTAYQWYWGSSATCASDTNLGGTASTYAFSPTSSQYVCVAVTDSAYSPSTVSSATNLVTVNGALVAGAVTPASPSIDVGQTITLTSHASAGTPSYSYQWIGGSSATCGSDSSIGGATSSTYAASPASSQYYCYSVTDSAYTPANASSATDLVTVNPDLVAGAVTPAAPTIDSGQSITLTAHASLGTAPYTYQWFFGPSGACDSGGWSNGGTASTYAVSPTSTTLFCYTVTDSANTPTSATSATDTVTVNPALNPGAITPINPTVISGNSETLVSHASGGTTAYSYLWYSGGDANCSNDTSTGVTTSSYTITPATSGYYCVVVTDSAYAPSTKTSAADYVIVQVEIIYASAAPINTTAITITWVGPPGVSVVNYTVGYAKFYGVFIAYFSVGLHLVLNVSSLAPGTTYYFTVWFWTASAESPPSNVVPAQTDTNGSGPPPPPFNFPWAELTAVTMLSILGSLAGAFAIAEWKVRPIRNGTALAIARMRQDPRDNRGRR